MKRANIDIFDILGQVRGAPCGSIDVAHVNANQVATWARPLV